MSIDPNVFTEFFTILTDHFGKKYSDPTIREWFVFLNGKISTDEFVLTARHFFQGDYEFMPKPKSFVDFAESRRTKPIFTALEAQKDLPVYELMTEEEKVAYRAAQEAVKAKLRLLFGMTKAEKAKPDRSQWANDPILSQEMQGDDSHENF